MGSRLRERRLVTLEWQPNNVACAVRAFISRSLSRVGRDERYSLSGLHSCGNRFQWKRWLMHKYIDMGANISACGKYRYSLWREWRGTHDPKNWRWIGGVDGAGHRLGEPKSCLFIMLNPSTADGMQDDPTIRRCVAFAKAWNFERLEVVNLFAYRATQPAALLALNHHDDPVGPENLRIVSALAQDAGKIICAWGANGSHLGQDEQVLGWIEKPAYALKITAGGHPGHPLYIPSKAVPLPFRHSVSAREPQ